MRLSRLVPVALLVVPLPLAAQHVEVRFGPPLHETERDTLPVLLSPVTRFTPAGVLLVDAREQTVTHADRQGRRLWTAGRRGEGPGETRMLDAVWVTADELLVHDRSLVRTSAFSLRDGTPTRTVPDPAVPAAVAALGVEPRFLATRGECTLWTVNGGADGKSRMLAVRPNAAPVTVWSSPFEAAGVSYTTAQGSGSLIFPYQPAPIPAFRRELGVVAIPSAPVVTPSSASLTLAIHDFCGRTAAPVRTFRFAAIPLPNDAEQGLRDRWRTSLGAGKVSAAEIGRVLKAIPPFPAAHPPLATLGMGLDGQLFGRRDGTMLEMPTGGTRRWVVFPVGGATPVEFTLAATMTVLDVRGKELLVLDHPEGPGGVQRLRIGTLP